MIRFSAYFRHADFRRLALGTAWHSASFQGEQVLIGLLVYRMTGSSVWVGVAYALAFTPMLLIGLPAGMTADRFDRRRLLPLFEIAGVVLMGVLTVVFALDLASVPLLLVAVFATGALRALHHPVRLSYAHDLLGAEQLVGALSMLSVVGRLGQMIGAVVAGWALEYAGAATGYGALAVMHLLALVALVRLRDGGQSVDARAQSVGESIREYLHEMRHNTVLWRLTLIASAVEIFGFSFATALPELASDRLGVGADGLGYLHAARSVDGIPAGLALLWAGGAYRTGVLYVGVVIGFGIALGALAGAPTLGLAFAAVALVAACAASCDVLVQSMLQFCVPDRLRGRAMGAWVLALGAGPLGHLQVGGLAAVLGAGLTLAANGAVLLAIGLYVLLAMPRVRRL